MGERPSLSQLEAIQMSARRYCLERHQLLSSASGWREGASFGIDQRVVGPRDLEPRYEVLGNILMGVEGLTPGDFSSPEAMVEALCAVSQTAEPPDDSPWSRPKREPERGAEQDERDQFCRYLKDLPQQDLSQVEPLPFRLTLGRDEVRRIQDRIAAKWPGIYEHVSGGARPDTMLLMQAAWYDVEVSNEALRQALLEHGVERVYFLPARGARVEMELSLVEPRYSGSYPFWADKDLEWLIYCAEDGSISFVGSWLIDRIKLLWPTWKQRVYDGWDYPYPANHS